LGSYLERNHSFKFAYILVFLLQVNSTQSFASVDSPFGPQGLQISVQYDPNCAQIFAMGVNNGGPVGSAPVSQKNMVETVLEDMDGFYDRVNSKFLRQKQLTPDDPYQFDYSEESLEALRFMEYALNHMIDRYQFLEMYSGGSRELDPRKYIKGYDRLMEERRFLQSVKSRVDSAIKDGISYRSMYFLNVYYGRAMAHSSILDLTPKTSFKRNIWDPLRLRWDNLAIDLKNQSVSTDHTAFLNGILPPKGRVHMDEDVLFNRIELKYVVILAPYGLSRPTLMRILNERIRFWGISGWVSQAADGLERDPRNWDHHDENHTARHGWFFENYFAEKQVTPEAWEEIRKQSRVWVNHLIQAIEKIEDPQLRAAVDWYAFRLTWDEGLPLVPSTFVKGRSYKYLYEFAKNEKLKHLRTDPVNKIMFEHYFIVLLSLGTQDDPLGMSRWNLVDVRRLFVRAQDWLVEFWDQYRDEENHLIQMHGNQQDQISNRF
jgi:hypothetical protein